MGLNTNKKPRLIAEVFNNYFNSNNSKDQFPKFSLFL